MEEEWIVDRSKLREVWFEHPNWSRKKIAKEVGRSEAWVRKWLKRIRQAPLEDREVLNGRSRVPHKLPPSIPEEVVNKILDIRDRPPARACSGSPDDHVLLEKRTIVDR
jgi:hypothetical protein